MGNNPKDAKTGKFRLHEEVELPIDGLPMNVQEYINEVARVYQCPREFVTVAVFCTFSTTIGKRVKVSDGKYTNPLMFWVVNVAPSGSNKTQPVKEVLKPLRDINHKRYQEYDESYNSWASSKEHNEVDEPKFIQVLVGDCTEEARIRILQNNTTGVLGYYPEIKGYFDDQERYNKNGGEDKLLRLYDGDDIYLNRKGESRPVVLTDVFMNIMGDIQPAMLKQTFGTVERLMKGLTSRFLFTMPDIQEFPMRSKEKMNNDIAADWRGIIRDLYYRNVWSWNPILIVGESDRLYNEYFNSLQLKKEEVKATTGDDFLLSLYSKLQIQTHRLAGIVHLMNFVNAQCGVCRQVTAPEMEYTIRCMNYFENSALAVYDCICGSTAPLSWGKITQEHAIREFSRHVKITNQAWFAKGISKAPSLVSRALNNKDKP